MNAKRRANGTIERGTTVAGAWIVLARILFVLAASQASLSLGCSAGAPGRAALATGTTDARETTCTAEALGAADRQPSDAALAFSADQLQIEGTKHVPREFVRVLMTKTPDAPLEPSELEGARKRLRALGAFERVTFHNEAEQLLTVSLHERPRVARVFFVGNASSAAVRCGLSPQSGDVFDQDSLVRTAAAIEQTWASVGERIPRVTVHPHRIASDAVDVCVRATALDAPRLERAVDEMERLYLEHLATPLAREYEDATLTNYVAALGKHLAPAASVPATSVSFTITNDASVRAAAAPKTRVITLSRGLLGLLGSEAQLAAVLAHELGHLALRHGLLDTVTQSLDPKAGGDGAVTFDAYQQMQADRVAIDVLERMGYDPHELLTALGTLLRSGFEEHATEASAHGMLSRLARIRLLLHGRFGGRVERAEYLSKIDGLLWGPPEAGAQTTRIRIRPSVMAGPLENALAVTCQNAGADSLALVRLNAPSGEPATIDDRAWLKCIE